MYTKMTNKEILALHMQDNNANAKTIRDYLKALLLKLWHEDYNFSGNRPFGDSDWQYEIHDTLVTHNADGNKYSKKYDEFEIDEDHAYNIIMGAIKAL